MCPHFWLHAIMSMDYFCVQYTQKHEVKKMSLTILMIWDVTNYKMQKIQHLFKDKNDIKLAHSPTIRFFHIQSFIKVASPPRSLFQQFFMPKYGLPSQSMHFTYISCYINLKRLEVSS